MLHVQKYAIIYSRRFGNDETRLLTTHTQLCHFNNNVQQKMECGQRTKDDTNKIHATIYLQRPIKSHVSHG